MAIAGPEPAKQALAHTRAEPARTPGGHIPALDGVRGLAVLVVFIYHYGGGAQSPHAVLRALGTALHAGWTGVTLFFLLSGFLITGILWEGRGRPGWWRRFYWRRTLRIFPLYYATLLLVVVASLLFGDRQMTLHHIWTYVFYGQDVPGLPPFWFYLGSPLYLTHFWSLAVEEQFYLIWPFAVVRFRSLHQARVVCAAVFVASVLFRLVTWAVHADLGSFAVSLPARAGELAAGGYLAMSFREASAWLRVQRLAPACLALGALGFIATGIAAGTFAAQSPLVYLVGLPCITVSFAGFLSLALRPGPIRRAMSAAWLRWLGGISYGIYVFHVLFGGVFHAIADALLPRGTRTEQLTLTFVVAAVLTLALAQLSFLFFESRFLRLKDKLAAGPKQ